MYLCSYSVHVFTELFFLVDTAPPLSSVLPNGCALYRLSVRAVKHSRLKNVAKQKENVHDRERGRESEKRVPMAAVVAMGVTQFLVHTRQRAKWLNDYAKFADIILIDLSWTTDWLDDWMTGLSLNNSNNELAPSPSHRSGLFIHCLH